MKASHLVALQAGNECLTAAELEVDVNVFAGPPAAL